jgi:hypothetical protein
VNNTDLYRAVPNTGVIRPYHFVISRGNLAPDGVEKRGLFINGQFPGPLIEANWGDTIQVNIILHDLHVSDLNFAGDRGEQHHR